MRDEACQQLIALAENHEFVFLTGDLGFNALEPLRDAIGEHFINAGIAEQNMVSVAAGLSSQGLDTWVYSIAPFCYARPFEQIRNDVCLHALPVKFVGNGGGYAYGPMGPSHHALEDYGTLLTLQHMRAYLPAFADDLASIVPAIAHSDTPSYLRLGRCEKPEGFATPEYAPWRKLLAGGGPVVVVAGPLAGGIITPLAAVAERDRANLWVVSELPIAADSLPEQLVEDLTERRQLCVAEEHVAQGGVGQMMTLALAQRGLQLDGFVHAHAIGYPSGTYGSQAFHRAECGLAPNQLTTAIARMTPCR